VQIKREKNKKMFIYAQNWQFEEVVKYLIHKSNYVFKDFKCCVMK